MKDIQKDTNDYEALVKQSEAKNREAEVRYREIEYKLGSVQNHYRDLE